MNTTKPILQSVVAICKARDPIEICPSISVMSNSADEYTLAQGLGLISCGLIYTCAHFRERWSLLPGDADIYAAWCLNDETMPHGLLAGLYASTLDFMILAPDGMTVIMSEDGGTETGVALLTEFAEKYGSDIRPTEVEFPPNMESAKIRGFFFGANGKTRHWTTFRIWQHSAKVEFYSNDFTSGCSGGPIFTENHQFIGVATVASTHPDLNGLHHCLGVRIDQSMPRLLSSLITWDSLVILPQEQAPDPADPWVQQQVAMDRHFRA